MNIRPRTATVAGRPGDGPVRAVVELIGRRRDGRYWVLELASTEIATRARPGQFIGVATDAPGALLRRPFSICRVSHRGAVAGAVEIVVGAHGPGTEWLVAQHVHDLIDVVGPLGTPFPLPQQPVGCLLVGGGYGVAPLLFLAEELTRRGFRVDVIAGAASADRICHAIELKRTTASVTFTTEDGSLGVQGRVTDVFEDVVRASGAGVVYGCGPMPMLYALAQHAQRLGLPCQVAVEEHMACGVGVCWTCVVPVRARSGALRMKRACIDGPVFNAARIVWEESRWGRAG